MLIQVDFMAYAFFLKHFLILIFPEKLTASIKKSLEFYEFFASFFLSHGLSPYEVHYVCINFFSG